MLTFKTVIMLLTMYGEPLPEVVYTVRASCPINDATIRYTHYFDADDPDKPKMKSKLLSITHDRGQRDAVISEVDQAKFQKYGRVKSVSVSCQSPKSIVFYIEYEQNDGEAKRKLSRIHILDSREFNGRYIQGIFVD